MFSTPRWLTTLIELRREDRTECRRRLGDAERAAAVLAQQEQTLQLQAEEVTQLRRDAAGVEGLDINRLLAAQRHQASLTLERDAVRQQGELLEQEIERRRTALIESERQVRTLEKLIDRKSEEARLRAGRQETKRLDEVASLMWRTDYRT